MAFYRCGSSGGSSIGIADDYYIFWVDYNDGTTDRFTYEKATSGTMVDCGAQSGAIGVYINTKNFSQITYHERLHKISALDSNGQLVSLSITTPVDISSYDFVCLGFRCPAWSNPRFTLT